MRLLLLPALPLLVLLAACDQNPAAPAAEQPVAQAPAPTTATEPAEGPAAGADIEPLFGAWSANLADCDTAAVRISEASFEGAENICDITAFEDNGDGSFTASLSCTSQGQQAEERIRMTPVFAPTGEGVTLRYLDRGDSEVTLLRCS